VKQNRKILIRMLLCFYKLFGVDNVCLIFIFSEESKPDSDLDEPWIMTVKGMHYNHFQKQQQQQLQSHPIMMMEDPMNSPIKHNGSNNGLSNRDSNLNHYKLNQVDCRN